jgi:hypothetical protein
VNSSATDETTDADALSTSFTETAFEGEVGGTYGLGAIIITGDLDLDADITSATSLSVSADTNLAADVTTSGTQTYGDDAASDATVTDGSRTLQGSTIQFVSTVTGTTAASDDLTITGALDLDGAITDINDLYVSGTSNIGANITTTGTQEYNNNVTLSGAARTLTTSGDTVTFTGTVNGGQDLTVDTNGTDNSSSLATVLFSNTVGDTTPVGAVLITGNLDLDADILQSDSTAGATSLEVTGTSDLGANVTTTGSTQQYDGAVTLSADVILTTTNSNATFGSTIDSDDASTKRDLTLTLGSGSASVTGIVGTTALDVLTLNSSSSFTAAVTASSIVNAASKTATFSDAVTANITNSGTLLFDTSADKSVTGTIAEAAGGGDTTEIKVIDSANGAPATVTFTGTIAADTLTVGTSSKAGAALFEEAVTVPTINITGGDVDAEDSTVTFNKAVTSSSGITLDDNTGDTKVIFAQNNTVNIASTIDGASSGEGTIQVTGATKTFTSIIGGVQPLTLINIDNTSIFNEAISATNINVADSITATAKKAITATAIVLDGGTLVLSDNNSVTIAGTINGSNMQLKEHYKSLGLRKHSVVQLELLKR